MRDPCHTSGRWPPCPGSRSDPDTTDPAETIERQEGRLSHSRARMHKKHPEFRYMNQARERSQPLVGLIWLLSICGLGLALPPPAGAQAYQHTDRDYCGGYDDDCDKIPRPAVAF